jgi:hypothetical protein
MSTFSNMAQSLSKGLLDQRQPQVLQEYAERVAQALKETGLAGLFNLDQIHQYQGHGTNHCGPTTLAMIINLILGEGGYDCDRVKYNDLQAAMQAGSLGFGFTGYCLQGTGLLHGLKVVNDITGATLPWGLEHAFADFNDGLIKSGGPNLGRATFAENGTKEDLLENIECGYKTALMVVWIAPPPRRLPPKCGRF